MRYLIKFSYDGTFFYGYQKQNDLRTVEKELENALFNINDHSITRVFAAGRTDRGVHALCQCAHFDINVDITEYKLKCAINSLTPDDIHVFSAEVVDNNFHSRFNAIEKTYIYKLNVGEYNPLDRNYVYQYNKELDLTEMQIAIKDFLGKHNFKSFVSDEVIKESYERIITEATVTQDGNIITFSFKGNGFMKYQVRNMVGTLIKVGKGKLPNSIVGDIFNDSSLKKHVYTAPPQGLYLTDILYKK